MCAHAHLFSLPFLGLILCMATATDAVELSQSVSFRQHPAKWALRAIEGKSPTEGYFLIQGFSSTMPQLTSPEQNHMPTKHWFKLYSQNHAFCGCAPCAAPDNPASLSAAFGSLHSLQQPSAVSASLCFFTFDITFTLQCKTQKARSTTQHLRHLTRDDNIAQGSVSSYLT